MKTRFAILGMAVMLPLAAQELKLPASFDKLSERASNVVDVNLDGPLLSLAARFLSDKDPDEAKVRKLVSGLKSVMVKSFEFDRRGEYDDKDLDDLRAQLKGPGWSRIVGVRSKRDGENAEVFLKYDGTQVNGIAIIAADPKELTIVNVIGNINPDEIRDLSGHFGIPKIDNVKPNGRGKEDER